MYVNRLWIFGDHTNPNDVKVYAVCVTLVGCALRGGHVSSQHVPEEWGRCIMALHIHDMFVWED